MSLLSLSPLLSNLFISYAKRAAALESVSVTPSPESEEWKVLQTDTIAILQEENEKLRSTNREVTEKLAAAEASQEAFRSQVSFLKGVYTTQHDDIKSLRELVVWTPRINLSVQGDGDHVTNLQDEDLSWLVEYLDDVRPRVAFVKLLPILA